MPNKQNQKSNSQKKSPGNPQSNGKLRASNRKALKSTKPTSSRPPSVGQPRVQMVRLSEVKQVVASETKRAHSSAGRQAARTKVHHSMTRMANQHVGPVDISAEERAIVSAFSTMHPELMRGKVPDSITSATSELRTVTNYNLTTLTNGGAGYECFVIVAPFLNDQIQQATAYAAGVCSTTAYADNPAYAAWVSNIGDFRLVSMSVVVENLMPSLNLTGQWVIGNARGYMTPLVGYNFNTYAQVVDFAKGNFTVDDPSCRMVWMANDETDRNFFPLATTPAGAGFNNTCVYIGLTSGASAGQFNLRITCNWEAIPVPAAQTYIATTATPTDPGTYTQAMAAASDSAIKHVEAVTNPEKADSASGSTLAEISTAALGVAGDVMAGDIPGLAKDAIGLLSPVKDAIGDAVGFVADGISSLFGLSVNADMVLRSAMTLGVLGESKAFDEIKKLDDKFGLKGKLYNPLRAIADLQLALLVNPTPKRIRDIDGIVVCVNGQQTNCHLPEGEHGRVKFLLRRD